MSYIEEQLDLAVKNLGLAASIFSKCDPEASKVIAQRAKDTFVLDNPRSWWMSLKYPSKVFDYSEGFGFEDLIRHVPPGEESCWLIAETEEDVLPVFEANVNSISLILGECSSFEYYLVGKRFDWLIVENDHNQVVVSHVVP